MATIETQEVLFGFGVSTDFVGIMKEPNKLYFLQDTQEIYLGGVRYAFGEDTIIQISGSGDTVANASYDATTKTLVLTLGNAGVASSVVSAIQAALATAVTHIYSDRNSAIIVDDADKTNVEVSLNLATGADAGNVTLSQNSSGLKAQVTLPEVPVQSVKSGDKVLSLEGTALTSTLSITTEVDSDTGKQYVILKGVGGVEISKFDASDFVTSGMLESVSLEDIVVEGQIHKFLVLTFLVAGGDTETVRVDLNDLMNVYSAAAGGGLTLDANSAFSITNSVTPNYGVNVDQNISFNSTVTLNTITYDNHGLITGIKAITFGIPGLSGSVGTSGSTSKLLTYVSMSSTGVLSGEYMNVVTSLGSAPTDAQIPTAKAVYDAIDAATPKWTRY